MLRSGKDYLAGLKDGRELYIGGERVDDVTTHPAFKGAANTFASLFDMKADPANQDVMAFEEDGERYAMYYLMPRSADDLLKRTKCHRAIASHTYGLMGRSPDHVSSFVTAMAMTPAIFDQQGERAYSKHVVNYYEHLKKNDLYVTYAVHPAPQSKAQNLFGDTKGRQAVMRVTSEDDKGITLNGMKMLATAGMFCDEVWIGNLTPISEERKKEAITCAVPMNTPGLSLWARKPMELHAVSEYESPLTSRYDEGDVMLIFEDVHVPWERVFVHDHPHLSREVYLDTAAHSFGNHQSNVRAHEKIKFLVGLIHKIAVSAGVDKIPVVGEKLGRMAALEAALAAMIYGQIQDHETLEDGFVNFNRRYMAAALNWCQEHFPIIIAELREISGGSVFQMPADISVLGNPDTRDQFLEYWRTDKDSAIDRVKLYKLAWDIFGSEFGNRHTQYENFYAGASFVVRSHSARYAPWDDLDKRIDELLASINVPDAYMKDDSSAQSAAE